ncbi:MULTISPECIES: DUF2970 domain-containing protein [unclassified Microbulbifer]|uniref:DUF2970 domain-containing protein n=1 Tax=Microbulbifer spongiae TaxID=2944933 RepID=A0ABY9E880_9GAMM|nr:MULTISPECIES: DUF2970 domain-containing protein [unclassified Microbulbifer]MDP5209041.1 DUF2970 domain-containing protein [Microbulbifer sp. 2205BS26-8]WKD48557.1 DUF2970 domain-containing protein [Microbulbifer sp. MI-G]
MQESNGKKADKPGFGQIVLSTLAAAIGVQSNKNRKRDFQSGSVMHYLVAGIVFTILFVLILAGIVKGVLSNMG